MRCRHPIPAGILSTMSAGKADKKNAKRHKRSLPHLESGHGFSLSDVFFATPSISFTVHFSQGRIRIQMLHPRLTADDVARILHTDADGVTYLVHEGLLDPIGTPSGNKRRFFFAEDLLENIRDRKWVSKVTDALYSFIESRNADAQERRRQNATALDNAAGE
jgi:hypothetical protein